jgi:hypothetical protein
MNIKHLKTEAFALNTFRITNHRGSSSSKSFTNVHTVPLVHFGNVPGYNARDILVCLCHVLSWQLDGLKWVSYGTCNPTVLEAEIRGPRIQGQAILLRAVVLNLTPLGCTGVAYQISCISNIYIAVVLKVAMKTIS